MKKIAFILSLFLTAMIFSGCVSFKEEYKPLYQAQPQIEDIERD